ncbi:hypothetical protein COU50_00630 [bacterium CG10_big_fil_rev_8_21_14_0_10_33_18]|nr:MAG: hypothetical protein COU50_00630 [bacterium CG10_big_fil_rev_8_21_14_0_10_33_18]
MKIPSPDFLRSRWFLVLGLIVVGYVFFMLGKMIWQNYQVNQHINNLQKEVLEVERENQKLSDLIAFFQTETFKEKEAKEKLGMVKPGEKVLVFPDAENNEKSITDQIDDTKTKKESEQLPNYVKWWNFFFKSSDINSE